MIELHPQILKKKGREQFVILSYEEFQAILEALEDVDDLKALQQARQEDDPTVPSYTLEQVRIQLGLDQREKTPRRGVGPPPARR